MESNTQSGAGRFSALFKWSEQLANLHNSIAAKIVVWNRIECGKKTFFFWVLNSVFIYKPVISK